MYVKKGPSCKRFALHQRERGDTMAVAQLDSNPSIIIAQGKTQKFFGALKKSTPSSDSWKECQNLRESINESNIDAMDALITKESEG